MDEAQIAAAIYLAIVTWVACGVAFYFLIREGFRRLFHHHDEPWSALDARFASALGLLGPFALGGSLIWWWIVMPTRPATDVEPETEGD